MTPRSDRVKAKLIRQGLEPDVEVLPDWARETRQRFDEFANWRRLRAHQGWSLVRQLPRFLVLLVAYAPRGLWRLARMLFGFLLDQDTARMRHQFAEVADDAGYERTSKRRRENLRARWVVALTIGLTVSVVPLAYLAPSVLGVIAGVVVVAVVVHLIPGKTLAEYLVAVLPGALAWWGIPKLAEAYLPDLPATWLVGVVVVAVLVLGWVGRPLDRGLVQAASPLAAEQQRITAPYAIDALLALKIPDLDEKHRDDIRLLSDVARVGGMGSQVDLELPRGVTATSVMDKREQYAGALRRELGCVWPYRGVRHPSHLRLFIADQPMATARQKPWPLLERAELNAFEPQPQFTDQQGNWVDFTPMYQRILIAGESGSGKTFCERQIAIGLALDPRTRLHVFDGKGNGDLSPLALVAEGYYLGDEEDEIAEQLDALRGIRAEMRRRAKFLRDLPNEEAPDSKVTDELVNRYPHLAPIVVVVDEVQVYTEADDKETRDEFIRVLTDLGKRGRSAGIVPIYATQKPDKDTLPAKIASQCSIRVCFRVQDWQSNNQVLGTGAHAAGLQATLFTSQDIGIAWVKGNGPEPQICRTVAGLDAVEAEKLMVKARQVRQNRGLLRGYAAEQIAEDEADQVRLLEDVRGVFATSQVMHLVDICAGLARRRPDLYGHLDNAALATMLRTAGVEVRTVHVPGKDRAEASGKGVKREWLTAAATDEIATVKPTLRAVPDGS